VSRVFAVKSITIAAKTLAKKAVFAAVRHFYHKKLDEEPHILFYYESFRFASFSGESDGCRKEANGDFCRHQDCEYLDSEMQPMSVLTAVHL
jgi:hypothetical protein